MPHHSRRHRPDTVKLHAASGTIEVDATNFLVEPPLTPDLTGRLRQLCLVVQADPAVTVQPENPTPADVLRTAAQHRIQALDPAATALRADWARCSGLYWAYLMSRNPASFLLMLIAWRDDAGVWRTPQGEPHPDREAHALRELPHMREHHPAHPHTVLVC